MGALLGACLGCSLAGPTLFPTACLHRPEPASNKSQEELLDEKARKWQSLNAKRYGEKRKFGVVEQQKLGSKQIGSRQYAMNISTYICTY